MQLPDDVVELTARQMIASQEFSHIYGKFSLMDDNERQGWLDLAQKLLGKVAPFIVFHALMQAADAAQADELATAQEVIYDIRRMAAQEMLDKL